MPKYKNFLFITNNEDLCKKITKELWERKKSWCIISTNNIYEYDVKRFMGDDNYKRLIITKPDNIVSKKVNDFIRLCNKYDILPIFITTSDSYSEDIVHTMYSNLEEVLNDSFEYIHNDKDVDSYNYALNLLTEYLW